MPLPNNPIPLKFAAPPTSLLSGKMQEALADDGKGATGQAGDGLGGVVVFNRGPTQDERGESMVQKHMEKLQIEKENYSMEKLGALMPQLGGMVRALALAETGWNIEQALDLLRRFYANHADKLKTMNKVGRVASQECCCILGVASV